MARGVGVGVGRTGEGGGEGCCVAVGCDVGVGASDCVQATNNMAHPMLAKTEISDFLIMGVDLKSQHD